MPVNAEQLKELVAAERRERALLVEENVLTGKLEARKALYNVVRGPKPKLTIPQEVRDRIDALHEWAVTTHLTYNWRAAPRSSLLWEAVDSTGVVRMVLSDYHARIWWGPNYDSITGKASKPNSTKEK